MTLQQLKYILAIDRHRNFAKAAEVLGVTQPTLSSMLSKLEEELDVRLFDRTNKSVRPTLVGEKIIRQARRVCQETERIGELVAEEREEVSGRLRIAIGPSIAPYVLPQFIRHYTEDYPDVTLTIDEVNAEGMVHGLLQDEKDVAIATGGLMQDGLLEIPLYTERFWVYLSEECWHKLPVFRPENLEHEQMWIMKDVQCLRDSAFSFCKGRSKGRQIYEAGSIETLIRSVDANGGFTIIPEMQLAFLTERQRKNVRPIDGDYLSWRRVSLYVKDDYVRQHMLNSVADTFMKFMPRDMMDAHLVKFGVKL